MVRSLLFSFLLISISSHFAAYSQIDTNNLILATTQENLRYLRYFNYQNNYGPTTVDYTVGEFNINSGANSQRIILHKDVKYQQMVRGNSELGEDTKLRDLSRSYDFVVPANSSISFYRLLKVQTSCKYRGGGHNGEWYLDDPQFKALSPAEKHWASGIGTILDSTEWTIQVVSSVNDSCLHTIDSIGIYPNPTSFCGQVYGTNPENSNLTVNLPAFLVGQNVYIRVSPRRWGPTPLGMRMKEHYTGHNISLSSRLVNGQMLYYSDKQNYQLDTFAFDKLIEVFDAEIAAGKCLSPIFFRRMELGAYFYHKMENRYPQCFTQVAMNKQMDVDMSAATPQYANTKHSLISSVSPTPISGSEFKLALNSKITRNNYKYSITSIKGNEIVSGIIPSIPVGETSIKIQLPAGTNSGSYNLSITNASGMNFGSTMIMVQR